MNLMSASSQLDHEHSRQAIARRLTQDARHSYLGDFVLGAVDGAVTTFAIVAGAAGAGLSNGIVLVLGCANVLADGLSMAAGNYLRARSDHQILARFRRLEETHVERSPEGEREEVRQIYAAKGFEGELLERVVECITADRRRWIDAMLIDEWNLQLNPPSPWRCALATFIAFLLAGAIPLAPAIVQIDRSAGDTFLVSSIATGLAFLFIGLIRGRAVARNPFYSALETLLIGGCAAAVAFLVGMLLRPIQM
jgi:VIT1/CCC1 family predicted Fe2+/Mn2+ transporter